jgi:predicted RNA binding protein YcfA (HicA-like mRNA interferase family)
MSKLPAVSARQVVAALKKAGFEERRQRGSHLRMFHPTTRCQTIVPIHSGDLKRGTLHGILRHSGLSEEQFRGLL